MAKFFIDRPVFAMVIAMVIVIVGAIAIPTLPIATYPEVVPPVVQIIAQYRGAIHKIWKRRSPNPSSSNL